MMNRIKRFFLISAVISLLPAILCGTPADSDGDGLLEISDFDDLQWVSANPTSWSYSYELTGDIDASASSALDTGDHDGDPSTPYVPQGFKPIGRDTNGDGDINDPGEYFSGSLFGNGFTISNLYINRPKASFQGLFGHIVPGDSGQTEISDLKLKNIDFRCDDFSAGLCGYIEIEDKAIEINKISVSGSISGASRIGGIIGYIFAGTNNASISESCSEVNLSGSYRVGGIAGYILGNAGIVSVADVFCRGDVAGTDKIGGLFGYTFGSSVAVANSYSDGTVVCSGNSKGALVGEDYQNSAGYSSVFFNKETSGLLEGVGNISPDPNGVIAASDSAMKVESTFTDAPGNWDFDDKWIIIDGINDGYPFLKSISDTEIIETITLKVRLLLRGRGGPTLHAPAAAIIEIYEDTTSDSANPAMSYLERYVGIIDSSGYLDIGILPETSKVTASGSYYLMVKVTGYLTLLTPESVSQSSGLIEHDFTTGYDKAAGGDKALLEVDGTYYMKAGDFNRDFIIDADDTPIMAPGYGSNINPYIPTIE